MAIQKKRISETKEETVKKELKNRKVIYVEIDDEITSVFDKIAKLKFKSIYLVVPQRAVLFQSAINLKILKRKAEDLEKKIFIITNDSNGLNLCQRVGIEVFDKLEGQEHPSLVSGKFSDNNEITPLKATINSVDEASPSRRVEKKLSISELIRKGSKGFQIIPKKQTLRAADVKENIKKEKKTSFVLVTPNKRALFGLILVSCILLLFISYIALPGATILLTPKSNVVDVTSNVTLADYDRNKAELDTRPAKMIPSYQVTTKIERVFTYQATGKDFQGTNARGKVLIKNTSGNDWPLIPKTRFQTSDGLVFRLERQVLVPSGTAENPGVLEAEVVADPLDAFGQVIGEKGNLPENINFFLPGLSADNQKKIFAVSKAGFAGGQTQVNKLISAEDIEAARTKMDNELKAAAAVELKSLIDKKNQEQKTALALLEGKNTIQMGTPEIIIPENLAGQKLESFDVKGRMVATGIAYNKDEMLSILKNELRLKKNPEKSLAFIDEDSLSYRIANNDDNAKKITITATIKGIEEFEVSPKKENGERLIRKIKEQVIGKDIREAKDFIQNLAEIERVEIVSWPAWAPTMPSVADNIKIEIRRNDN